MNRIKSFGAFWYDFVIGDDWHVAALVVAGLALTAILVRAAHVNAWWLLPLFVFAALGWSLHRATSKELSSRTEASGTSALALRGAAQSPAVPQLFHDHGDIFPAVKNSSHRPRLLSTLGVSRQLSRHAGAGIAPFMVLYPLLMPGGDARRMRSVAHRPHKMRPVGH